MKYAELKPQLISEKIANNRGKEFNELYEEMNCFKKREIKNKRSFDLNYKINNNVDIQIKGIDTKIEYNYKVAKQVYEKITKNRKYFYLKKKEINDLLGY